MDAVSIVIYVLYSVWLNSIWLVLLINNMSEKKNVIFYPFDCGNVGKIIKTTFFFRFEFELYS